MSEPEREIHMAELLAMSFVAQLAEALADVDEPEALMMTALDLFAAQCIVALEKLQGIERDVALTKHSEHVARLLQELPRRA